MKINLLAAGALRCGARHAARRLRPAKSAIRSSPRRRTGQPSSPVTADATSLDAALSASQSLGRSTAAHSIDDRSVFAGASRRAAPSIPTRSASCAGNHGRAHERSAKPVPVKQMRAHRAQMQQRGQMQQGQQYQQQEQQYQQPAAASTSRAAAGSTGPPGQSRASGSKVRRSSSKARRSSSRPPRVSTADPYQQSRCAWQHFNPTVPLLAALVACGGALARRATARLHAAARAPDLHAPAGLHHRNRSRRIDGARELRRFPTAT